MLGAPPGPTGPDPAPSGATQPRSTPACKPRDCSVRGPAHFFYKNRTNGQPLKNVPKNVPPHPPGDGFQSPSKRGQVANHRVKAPKSVKSGSKVRQKNVPQKRPPAPSGGRFRTLLGRGRQTANRNDLASISHRLRPASGQVCRQGSTGALWSCSGYGQGPVALSMSKEDHRAPIDPRQQI